MCNPVLAIAAIAAGTQALGVISSNQAAKQANRAINAQNAVRKTEIDQAATAEINDRLRDMRREQSRVMVAAGEAGLSLNSGGVESLLMDGVMQAELSADRSLANRESRKMASDADAQTRMQSKYTALGAGLKIALAGASAGMGAQNQQAAATNAGR